MEETINRDDPAQKKEKTDTSSLLKLYKFFEDNLKMKNQICKWFLFKPPSPRGYKFEKKLIINGELKMSFFLMERDGKAKAVVAPFTIEIEPFVLNIMNKENRIGFIPLIYLKNNKSEGHFVIIYSHGNASDLGDVYSYAANLSILYRTDVIAYDYRGYGIADCFKTKEKFTYEDLEYTMSFAQEKLKYKINHIILWGFSLGTGPTIEIASRYQNLGGVILQSPLASLMIWMDKNAKWDYNYSLSDVYCSINKIENVKAKLFIIHGKRDKTIDVRHSHLLYDKYINSGSDNNQIWLVIAEGAGHNDIQFLIEDCGGPFYKRIQKFLDMIKNPMKTFESKIGCKSYEKFMKREENKQFFYEKEVTSLKISFNNLLVNSYELEDNSKKIETSLTESRSSIKTALNSSQSSLLNKLNKDSDDNNLLELLKRNDCYISKEIPHSINISFCDDITFKKTNSVMYSSSNINIQENEQFRTTIKDFQNVNDFLIKNYFAKN